MNIFQGTADQVKQWAASEQPKDCYFVNVICECVESCKCEAFRIPQRTVKWIKSLYIKDHFHTYKVLHAHISHLLKRLFYKSLEEPYVVFFSKSACSLKSTQQVFSSHIHSIVFFSAFYHSTPSLKEQTIS